MNHSSDITTIFAQIGISLPETDTTQGVEVMSPIDARRLGALTFTSKLQANASIDRAAMRFKTWRKQPAPLRGAIVREWGELVRKNKPALAQLITLEAGKIVQESLGEVQEVVDICDFAVGLSRQLYGLTIASERHQHKLLETWHPIGPVGVISAFNFPMAVYAWNAALALVCGNTLVWKPSEKAPYCALALHGLLLKALSQCDTETEGLAELLIGDATVGEELTAHPEIKLLSATGSTRMGIAVATSCARSFKRTLLELGGNNAAIVCPSADIDLVTRAVVFSAVGTAGQRCTTLRRLIVHRSIYQEVLDRLLALYAKLPIGDPRSGGVLVGPLIDKHSFDNMQNALKRAVTSGGEVFFGMRIHLSECEDAYYVRPAIVAMASQEGPMLEETFAPILYLTPFDNLECAIALNNAVSHGLSSSIFTQNLLEAETFTSATGSDCGIANVNIGTSGAEIGGAFGGEKETGGGRESGSDSWKAYMRRATNTINYGTELPLAQGIKFDF
jgi:aldehyde dehydrogenase (NAD+)